MGRTRLLLSGASLLLAASILFPHAAYAASNGCSSSDFITGCQVGDGVVIEGNVTLPGSVGGGGSGGHGAPNANPPIAACLKGDAACLEKWWGDPPEDGQPGTPPVTIADIAWFRPAPGVQYMQPDGWTVPGLHTNFYAVTGTQIVDGTLLGQPASVRFTPVTFHWTYGDGASASLGTPGATWEALRVAEFDPTPTSHVYAEEGEYTIRLTIDFAAEYRFAGGPFIPIDGRIPLPANELHITVDGAKTVLVEHDCVMNPSGPGC